MHCLFFRLTYKVSLFTQTLSMNKYINKSDTTSFNLLPSYKFLCIPTLLLLSITLERGVHLTFSWPIHRSYCLPSWNLISSVINLFCVFCLVPLIFKNPSLDQDYPMATVQIYSSHPNFYYLLTFCIL